MRNKLIIMTALVAGISAADERVVSRGETPENWGRLPRMAGWYQGKPIQFRVLEGMALVEGDIILGPVEELLRPPTDEEKSRAAVALTSQTARWPNKTIVYQIDSALPNQTRVTDAIKHWEDNTSIRFKQRTNETAFVTIRRAASGCNSNIGYTGGAQTVNLADSCSTGNTIHELGHTVGFYHTQSRGDRDRYIRVRYENIDKGLWDQYDQHLTTTSDIGPYDYNSIMHYSAGSDTRNFRNSIDTYPLGIPLGQRTGLSVGDIHATERIYGGTVDGVTITSNLAGAPVTVDGQRVTTPRTFAWKAGEQHTISAFGGLTVGSSTTLRYQFAGWTDDGDREHTITVKDGTTYYSADYSQTFLVRTAVSPANAGTVKVTPESEDGFYPYGTVLQFTATPASDAVKFFGWTAGQGGATSLAANGQGNASNPAELTLRNDGMFYVASFAPANAAVTTITSKPSGAVITVDGTAAYTPRNEQWAAGSSHTVAIAAAQTIGSGRQLVFGTWSNDGTRSQSVPAPTTAQTLTANLTERFEVLTDVNWVISRGSTAPTAARNITVTPTSPDDFYETGTVLEFTAEGPATAPFVNWYGDLGGSTATQKLTVKEQTSVTASYLSEPFVYSGGFVNAGSRQPTPGSPGAVMVLYRPGIGTDAEVDILPDGNGKQPTSYNGISVTFGGTEAQLLKLAKNGLMLRVPETVTGSSASVTVRAPSGNYTTVLPMATKSPGIFTVNGTGVGQVYAFNEDKSENGESSPASRDGLIVFQATGLGRLGEDGAPLLSVWAEIGGVETDVLTFPTDTPGVLGVVAYVDPATPVGAAVPLALFVNGTRSQYTATVAIQ